MTWVDPQGAAQEELAIGDVIEAAEDEALETKEHWDVRTARLAAGEAIRVRIRRRGDVRDVVIVAAGLPAPSTTSSLGLRLQRVSNGTRVTLVEPGSAAGPAP